MKFSQYLEIASKIKNQNYYTEATLSDDLKKRITDEKNKNPNIKEIKKRNFYEFSDSEKKIIYDVTTETYMEKTGASWTEQAFYNRASAWTFFGNIEGYVAVREQGSGNYKLVSVGGDDRVIVLGLRELEKENKVIWGVVTDEIAKVAKSRQMIIPPGWFIKLIFSLNMIPSYVFGEVKIDATKIKDDGGIPMSYYSGNFNKIDGSNQDVTAIKYYIANEKYYIWLNNELKNKYGIQISNSDFLKIMRDEANPLQIASAFKNII